MDAVPMFRVAPALTTLILLVATCTSDVSDDDAGGGGSGATACVAAEGCDAQDAAGEGSCEAIIGTMWNGSACVDLSGCSCAGCDCGALYSGIGACEAAHASCLGLTICGGSDDVPCGADAYCDKPNAVVNNIVTGCGAPSDEGVCRPRPNDCVGEPSTPNCGCDGNLYPTYCDTNSAGVDVATGSDGTCP